MPSPSRASSRSPWPPAAMAANHASMSRSLRRSSHGPVGHGPCLRHGPGPTAHPQQAHIQIRGAAPHVQAARQARRACDSRDTCTRASPATRGRRTRASRPRDATPLRWRARRRRPTGSRLAHQRSRSSAVSIGNGSVTLGTRRALAVLPGDEAAADRKAGDRSMSRPSAQCHRTAGHWDAPGATRRGWNWTWSPTAIASRERDRLG